MSRTPKQPSRKLSVRNTATKVRTVPCIAHASQPRIVLSGAWLRAAGFVRGKPCLVRAFARRQLIVYQLD